MHRPPSPTYVQNTVILGTGDRPARRPQDRPPSGVRPQPPRLRRRQAAGTRPGPRARSCPRPPRRARFVGACAGRRARDHRLLARPRQRGRWPSSASSASSTSRSTSCRALRGDRAQESTCTRRGPAAARPSAVAPVPLLDIAQAGDGRGCGASRLRRARPVLAVVAVAIKLDSRGPGLLPPGANGRAWAARSGSGSSGRWPSTPDERKAEIAAPEHPRGRTTRRCSRSRTIRASRVWAASFAASRSTSCRSSSTSSRRDEPRRPAAADPRRGPARRRLGPKAPRPQARASPASGRCSAERHPVRRDGQARLPLRHELVADGRHQADRFGRSRRSSASGTRTEK